MTRTNQPFQALLIPADDSEPITRITVRSMDDIVKHVGLPEACHFGGGSQLFVGDDSLPEPFNLRASSWVFRHSEAAKEGWLGAGDRDYSIWGDCVVTGIDSRGLMADVPERLVEHFRETYGIANDDLGISL